MRSRIVGVALFCLGFSTMGHAQKPAVSENDFHKWTVGLSKEQTQQQIDFL